MIEIMPDTSENEYFDWLYDTVRRITNVELRSTCRYVGVEYDSLRDESHIDRSYALVERLGKQHRLPELEATLRRHFPSYFAQVRTDAVENHLRSPRFALPSGHDPYIQSYEFPNPCNFDLLRLVHDSLEMIE